VPSPKNNPFSRWFKRTRSASSKPVASSREKREKRFFQTLHAGRTFPALTKWRFLPLVLNKKERTLFWCALCLLVVSVFALLISWYVSHVALGSSRGGTYTEGVIGTPQFVNPLYAQGNDIDQDLVRLVYTGLMQWHPTEGLVTDLAESYTISDDERVYAFTLRDDALWHDGTPVTIRDVIFTFNAIQNPEYKSSLHSAFRGVTIEQIDDRSVAFTLSEPFAPFLAALTVGILPAEYWGDLDPTTARLAERNLTPMGSGPYAVLEFTKDKRGAIQSYTLERFEDFYGGEPNIDTIEFKMYESLPELLLALKNHNVEGAAFVPKSRVDEFSSAPYQLINPHLPQVTALFFNVKHEYVEDARVRQALSAALDKDVIVETVLKGHGTVAHSLLLPDSVESPLENPLGYSPDKARTLLEEVGFDDETHLPITLTTVDQEETVLAANSIADMWRAVGVDVTVKAVDPARLREEVLKDRSYDILLSGTLYGIDPDPYPFWHSSQATHPGLNLSQYANRDVDKAIEKARTLSDVNERQGLYREVATTVNASLPAIFLYQPTYSYVTSSRIRGINIDSIVIPADRFGQVHEWYIKTRRQFYW